jgi:alkylhydroperoxidase/carboxymuconolactone decarboxylase family protein YurZ
MVTSSEDRDSLADLIADDGVTEVLRDVSPGSFQAASHFWRTAAGDEHLSPRMRELVLLAMHGTSTALNTDAVERHVGRALAAGATPEEVVDVLITIVTLANHALYATVPIFEEEAERAGLGQPHDASVDAELEAAKQEFVATRGFWNPQRELLIRLVPDYLEALTAVSSESWKNGPLTAKERELVCIGIDCTVTHIYEPGLRAHIKNAFGFGATRAEVLQVLQLAGTLGLEGYLMAGRALARRSRS